MSSEEVVIARVWRSELVSLVIMAVSSVASVVLSHRFPDTVLTFEAFHYQDKSVVFTVPSLWLIPCAAFLTAFFRIYNVRYSIDSRGIEMRTGRLSLNQLITRIRFEDIRSIEAKQTLLEQLLDVGAVSMGTAATSGLEVVFSGIGSPRVIQGVIQREREARERLAKQQEQARAQAAA